VNLKAIANAEKAGAELMNVRAFLILWNGSLISENYYAGTTAETLFHLRSITKSIVSALVGIAIEKGILRSVNDKVLTYIPELISQDHDARKEQVTIRHLLTMTSGFQWDETGDWFIIQTRSALAEVWGRPLVGNPGEVYNYNSAAIDLLTVVLTRAAQQEAKTFLVENLFAPLDINHFEWEKDPAGYHRGSGGLVMRAKDLSKIGQLYLQNGRWNQHQLIPSAWIEQSTAEQVRVNDVVSYGYLWRSRRIGSVRLFYGLGYGGQYLMVVPSLNIVVTANQEWHVSNEQADQQKYGFTDRVFDPMVKAWQK
jgi:CubicO group peptidase (beta-lactamase class C family)